VADSVLQERYGYLRCNHAVPNKAVYSP